MKPHDKYIAGLRKDGKLKCIQISLMPKDHDLKIWFDSVDGSSQVEKLRNIKNRDQNNENSL